jgi:hypothetical protein
MLVGVVDVGCCIEGIDGLLFRVLESITYTSSVLGRDRRGMSAIYIAWYQSEIFVLAPRPDQ